MPLFDLNSIRKGIQQAADDLKKTVADASEKVADSLKTENVNEAVKNLTQKGQQTFDSLREKGEETWAAISEKKKQSDTAISEALKAPAQSEIVLSIQDTLKIVYGLIAVDGVISPEEKEKFREIGNDLDPSFPSYCDDLINECTDLLGKPAEDEEDYYDTIHDYLGTIIHKASNANNGAIRGKLLLWDLLTIAQSDGNYSPSEKRLIRYIAKCMGIETALQLEMEHTVRTLVAIEREEAWLKNSDRPYSVIENRINELTDRKATVMTSIQALISD